MQVPFDVHHRPDLLGGDGFHGAGAGPDGLEEGVHPRPDLCGVAMVPLELVKALVMGQKKELKQLNNVLTLVVVAMFLLVMLALLGWRQEFFCSANNILLYAAYRL